MKNYSCASRSRSFCRVRASFIMLKRSSSNAMTWRLTEKICQVKILMFRAAIKKRQKKIFQADL
jgi:hypothetical protein